MKSLVTLFCLLVMLCPAVVLAELPRQVEQDFTVVSGTVVMPMGDEYIVDLDDSDLLHIGDILTLVVPGEAIYNPETKEVIGTVDTAAGYLQVVRIQSGYSYARPLSAEPKVKNGARVKRFEQVPALFADNENDDGTLARQMQMELPQLRWLKQGDAEQPLLTFELKNDSLVVQTADGNQLHRYTVVDSRNLEAPAEPAQKPAPKPEKKLLEKVSDSLLTTLMLEDPDRFTGKDIGLVRQKGATRKGIWMGPSLNGSPVGIAVADLDGDGQLETAVALENRLLIGRIIQDKYTELADIEVPVRLKTLSLDAIDLDRNGLPELYLTAVDEYQMSSFAVRYTGSDYETFAKRLRWYLRAADMPGGERILIGQFLRNDEQEFSGKPFRVRMEGEELVRGEEIELPGKINMYSFVPFTDKDGRLNYAYLSEMDHVKVVAEDGTELWESESYFGGSESCFMNRAEPWGVHVNPTCLRPRLIKTPANEILVVQNDSIRIMERYRSFKESRLVSLQWNGYAMNEIWRTVSQKGYLGDFAYADANNDGREELVMAVKFKHEGLTDEARSTIVTYQMN